MPAPRTFALLSVLLCSACADDPVDPCLLRPADDCDVREVDCQEHAHAVVACMREAEHPLPKIAVLTAEEFAAQYPPPAASTPEQAKTEAQVARAFQLLGFLPSGWQPEDPEYEVSTPTIFYDIEGQVVTMVVDGSDREGELHGLLYALALADRDAESGLQGLSLTQTGTFDSARALRTLYAGEATFYADLASVRDTDFARIVDEYSYDRGSPPPAAPSPTARPRGARP